MRILIWSTAPWVKTGYGKNCRYLIEALKDKHEITVISNHGLNGSSINYNGTTVLPSTGMFHVMQDWVSHWVKKLNIDIIIQHFDLWICGPNALDPIPCPTITYMPVDGDPLARVIYSCAKGSLDNVAMSEFAQERFLQAGMPSSKLIHHTVDRQTYYPVDKEEAKKELGIDPSIFLLGIVGTNKGPRKNIPGQLLAFKSYLEKNPNARLYLHTYMTRDILNQEGYDLYTLIETLNLQDYVLYTDQLQIIEGLSETVMRYLYSAFDILLECSFGEGWGIPIAEAQACGTPVVGTDFSAIPEVIGKGGETAQISDYIMFQSLGCFNGVPSREGIVSAIEKIASSVDAYRVLALENAKRFDFEIWREGWTSYLEKLF